MITTNKKSFDSDNLIPQEVQERIDSLDKYGFDDHILTFDSIHLYKKELAYPNGYYDAYFFEVIGYNEDVGKRKNLGTHDGVILYDENVYINRILLHADGSIFVGFKDKVFVSSPFQAIGFSKYINKGNKNETN